LIGAPAFGFGRNTSPRVHELLGQLQRSLFEAGYPTREIVDERVELGVRD
jgi:hypothetical protein